MQNDNEIEKRGAFFPDGSYDPEAAQVFRKGTDRLVRHLVNLRQLGKLNPEEAVRQIREATGERAFPNLAQWQRVEDWQHVQTSTSAEEAVKRCGGRGGEFHWCQGNWISGKEKECSNVLHRKQPTAEEVQRLVLTLGRAFE